MFILHYNPQNKLVFGIRPALESKPSLKTGNYTSLRFRVGPGCNRWPSLKKALPLSNSQLLLIPYTPFHLTHRLKGISLLHTLHSTFLSSKHHTVCKY